MYPVDAKKRTIFHQDVKFYSAESIYNDITKHLNTGSPIEAKALDYQGTVTTNLDSTHFGFSNAGKEIRELGNIVKTQTFGGTAWGLEWTEENSPGIFPQYFLDGGVDGYRTVVSEEDVPIQTGLLDVVLPRKVNDGSYSYEPPPTGWPAPAGGQTYTAELTDGSTISYGWYRFIDQPAIRKLNLSPDKHTQLQSVVEAIHAVKWGTSNPVLSPPTFGSLVEIADALIVPPPDGLDIGSVPVALRQSKT